MAYVQCWCGRHRMIEPRRSSSIEPGLCYLHLGSNTKSKRAQELKKSLLTVKRRKTLLVGIKTTISR